MTPDEIGNAIRAFGERECQPCGVEKTVPSAPFCDACMERLPPDLLENVTDRETYLGAFARAATYLKSASGETFDPLPKD